MAENVAAEATNEAEGTALDNYGQDVTEYLNEQDAKRDESAQAGDAKADDEAKGDDDTNAKDSAEGEGDGSPDKDASDDAADGDGSAEGDANPDLGEYAELSVEGIEADDPALLAFQKLASEREMKLDTAKALLGFYGDLIKDQKEAQHKVMYEGIQALKKDWGGDYSVNLAKSERFFRKVMTAQEFASFEAAGGINPAFARIGHKLAGLISDDALETGDGNPPVFKRLADGSPTFDYGDFGD